MEAHIRFLLIIGISKFSKVSIFSELNHLTDLTMNTAFGTALGLTETEIRENLADHIRAFAQKEGISEEAFIEQRRDWYNGFCFAPEAENVYNPFSTLLLFYHQPKSVVVSPPDSPLTGNALWQATFARPNRA